MPRKSAVDPSSLTKVELKKALKKNKILFGSSLLKDDLLKLYKRKVLNVSGFSTDDDDEEVSPVARITRSSKKTPQKARVELKRIDKMVLMDPAIEDMSDEDLAQKMTEFGISFGPIGPTTRKLYERRLEDILASVGGGDAKQEYSDAESDQEEEEEVVEIVDTPIETRHRSQSRRMTDDSPFGRFASATKRRPLHRSKTPEPIKTQDYVPAAKDKKKTVVVKPQRRWMPFFVTILVVAAIVAFLYAVYITMEPAHPRKILQHKTN